MSGRILVGTASWTEPSLIASGRFYPPEARTPEQRLRFYAHQFRVVEVDSSYYGLPAPRTAALWAERTPAGFVFDVKAFSLFTHHPAPPRSLPADLRAALPPAAREKAHLYERDVPSEVRDELFRRFSLALEPLAAAGKLGVVLFQFPPWFLPGRASLRSLAWLRERLSRYLVAVEFRAPPWFDAHHQRDTLAFLAEHELAHVAVDEPQGTRASVPPVVAVTAPVAVVRFHGRNRAAWAKRGATVAEKYDYLYTEQELADWVPRIRHMAEEAGAVHVIMNNCREDKAVVNARQLAALLDVPRSAPARDARA